MLKALSNSRFSLIPLNGKRRRDGRSLGRNRGAQVVEASSEDAFLRIPLYWFSLRLPRTGVGVCGLDHVGNGGRDDLGTDTSTPDTDKGADDPGTGTDTADADRRVDNRRADDPGTGINTPDVDGRADNRRADNPGTGTDIPDTDGRADDRGTDDPGTDTADANADADADGEADPGTNIADADANGRVAVSNKARASLFSLRKAFIFVLFFWIGDRLRLSAILNHFFISSDLGEARSPFV